MGCANDQSRREMDDLCHYNTINVNWTLLTKNNYCSFVLIYSRSTMRHRHKHVFSRSFQVVKNKQQSKITISKGWGSCNQGLVPAFATKRVWEETLKLWQSWLWTIVGANQVVRQTVLFAFILLWHSNKLIYCSIHRKLNSVWNWTRLVRSIFTANETLYKFISVY